MGYALTHTWGFARSARTLSLGSMLLCWIAGPPVAIGSELVETATSHTACGEALGHALAALSAAPQDAAAAYRAARLSWNDAKRQWNKCNPQSTDLFYQSAALSWHALRCRGCEAKAPLSRDNDPAAWSLYQQSLKYLLLAGVRHQSLRLPDCLVVQTPAGPLEVPIVRHGFPWQPDDFDMLATVGGPADSKLRCRYAWHGLGVSSVVVRLRDCHDLPRDRYFRDRHPFAATWVLHPDLSPWLTNHHCPEAGSFAPRLDCYDPLRIRTTVIEGSEVPLAGDISAPLAWLGEKSDANENALTGFFNPTSPEIHRGIYMLEPYQPGKAPVVFVHGLLGNPLNWLDLANDLRSDTSINEHCQLWAFNYPTGEGFLKSAADLRRDLAIAATDCDPNLGDPSLMQMVVIGHSMGGLLTKLQIASSGSRLWDSYFRIPFAEAQMSPAARREFGSRFFFVPNPFVKRAVFVATPHDGAPAGLGSLRVVASLLVERPEDEQQFKQFKRDNPGIVRFWAPRRLPASVDMLALSNPLLEAMRNLPVAPEVQMHTIYGRIPNIINVMPSDRVVPVSSARHPCVQSERKVRAGHAQVHTHPESCQEIRCILHEHIRESALGAEVVRDY
jgi:hypothetical protein